MTKPRLTSALVVVLLALTSGYEALAQTPPLTPGTVTNVSAAMTCPSDFSSTMTATGTKHCHTAVLHCGAQGANVPDINLTFGVEGPSTASTVVFFSGGPGSLSDSDINQYVDNYFSPPNNFQVVQIDWATTGWGFTVANSNANVLNAACRPAGFLKFVHDNLFHPGGTAGMCAQGISAGSAQVAYSLSWYGATLDNVELIAGPPLADIKTGCQGSAQPLTICGGSQPECVGWPAGGTLYSDARYETTYGIHQPELVQISEDTGTLEANGNASCEDPNSTVQSQDDPIWAAQGVAQPAIQNTSLAHTSMGAWLCASTTRTANNSSPEGWLYYNTVAGSPAQNLPTPFKVNAIYSCSGAEGESGGQTVNGVSGRTAIENDMVGSCKHHP